MPTRNEGTKRARRPSGRAAIERMDKAAKALELRKRGFSYREIAASMGVSTNTAYNLVVSALREAASSLKEEASEALQVELERLDALLATLWERLEFISGAPPEEVNDARLAAIVDRIIRVHEARARLLGLGSLTQAQQQNLVISLRWPETIDGGNY